MKEKILSVFIDESGDFGPYSPHAPLYLVTMVVHDQGLDITENVQRLDEHLQNLGYPLHAIHTGPLIRRESVYINDTVEDRKKLFNALFHFVRKLNVHYICAKVSKHECSDVVALTAKLSRTIADAIQADKAYFDSYDRIIVYYDNGQVELTKILTSVFNALFSTVEFRKVRPVDYKLFQAADLICTMELLKQKMDANMASHSEMAFFENRRDFKKNYWKVVEQKRL
jgi:hypothetical protein